MSASTLSDSEKAIELGRALGLDGEFPNYKELIAEPSRLNYARNLFNYIMNPTTNESGVRVVSELPDAVLIEFSQLYLPTFIDAYRLTLSTLASQTSELRSDEVAPPRSNNFQVYHSLLQTIIPKGPFGRYIREHETAGSFFSEVVDTFAASLVAYEESSKSQHVLDNLVFLPPIISRSYLAMSSNRLRQVAAFVSSSSLAVLQEKAVEINPAHGVFMLEEKVSVLEGKKDVAEFRQVWNELVGHVPWFFCERLNSQIRLKQDCFEAQEMDFCSRCKAVRYCCKAHQKEHWKWHKQFCFIPSW